MSDSSNASKTDAISEEFKKATDYALTDQDIARAKAVIGIDLANNQQEQISTASLDNIRTFAFATGSDNPLHCDPDHASTTRWGSVIAPSMMAGIINRPMLGDPPTAEYKANAKGLFRGIHVFISGGEWIFYKPIYSGDTLYCFRGVVSVEEQPSEFAGRKVNRITRDVKVNQRGEVVATYAYREIMTERKTAREKGKNLAIEPAKYTDEDIAKIDEIYAQEKSRGAEKRYWDDVQVGQAMDPGCAGPLTVTDVVNIHGAGYGWIPYGLRTGRLWYQNRNRIAPFYVKDASGIPDVAQRLHWDNEWAQAIGNPRAYDYGVMRENYIYRFLNDWAGDDGWVVRQYDEIRKFNLMGDTQFIRGEVVGKRQENGRNLVDMKVTMTNQRGEETVRCEATVALPDREGVTMLPSVPDELQHRATKMMARHWELLAKKKHG